MLASTGHPVLHTAFFCLKHAAAVPCGPAVTSPLLTMTSTTLTVISSSCLRTLAIMPSLLDGLTDVDVLHIALGCRFALDILTVSQHYSSALELDPLPDGPELFLF